MDIRHLAIKRLKFVGAGDFLNMFRAFQIVNIVGRFGGGKTALGVILAAWLLANERVDKVVANVPTIFNSSVPEKLSDAAIVLDEAWMYLEGRGDVMDYAAFARKHNDFLILPSVFDVHRRLSFFQVQRVFNAYSVGLPYWIYRWDLGMKRSKDNGYFAVHHPSRIFGLYDTEFVPGDDNGIADAISGKARGDGYKGTRREQRKKKNEREIQTVGFQDVGEISGVTQENRSQGLGVSGGRDYTNEVEELQDVVFAIEDAAAGAEEAQREVQELSKRIRRKI